MYIFEGIPKSVGGAAPLFYWSPDDESIGQMGASPDPWQYGSSLLNETYERPYIEADTTGCPVTSSNVMKINIEASQEDHYMGLKGTGLPLTLSFGTKYYFCFAVMFKEVSSVDIFNYSGGGFNKLVDLRCDNPPAYDGCFRWTFNTGYTGVCQELGNPFNDPDGFTYTPETNDANSFTMALDNPTCRHLVDGSGAGSGVFIWAWPNQDGYTTYYCNTQAGGILPQFADDVWHRVVIGITPSNGLTQDGLVEWWANGTLWSRYSNIVTTSIDDVLNFYEFSIGGTVQQSGWYPPVHQRYFGSFLITDDFNTVQSYGFA